MKHLFRRAFTATLPVLAGYMVLGFGFGVLLKASGYGVWLAFGMSLLVYAGSMQFVAVGLLTGGASWLTVALTTLMVNARHLFYGISMLEKYKNAGWRKPYLIFALTDETYSLLCGEVPDLAPAERPRYYFLVSLLNQIYWITGSVLGAAAGSLLSLRAQGIEFSLTALFLTLFLEQWLHTDRHAPALIGVGVSVLCLVLLGQDNFLIPSMLLIALLLSLYKEEPRYA